MLVPIVFIVAFMLALTGALLENSVRAAKVTLHAAVARYSDAAMTDGVADLTHGLAQYVATHGTAGSWTLPASRSALKPVCDSAPPERCSFHYTIRATITAASSDSAPSGADAAANLQASVINEQRLSAIVSATVIGPTGVPLGTRTRFLTYRIFETAPYAVVSGSRDIATVDGTQSAAQGDSGGSADAAPPADQSSTATAAFADTRIHVRLTCGTVTPNIVPFGNDQQAPGNDGLPWGDAAQAAYETPCTSPDAPADAFRDERWGNGDTNPTGWTQ